MKINEIRELSAEDLDKKLAELKEELFNLRFQMATGQCSTKSKNPLPESKLFSARTKSTRKVLKLN